jgi:putative transposase
MTTTRKRYSAKFKARVGELERRNITISMDGRGRFLDNIFIERLWRSLKYEEVYLKDYQLVSEARTGIENYFHF